jgi:hypothetical protein
MNFSWLLGQLELADAIEDDKIVTCPVTTEVGEEERILGTVPDNLKKMFVYLGRLADVIGQKRKLHVGLPGAEHTESVCRAFHKENVRLVDQLNALTEVFWVELKHFLDADALDDGDSVGIRKDWTIVAFKPRPNPFASHGGNIVVMLTSDFPR